MRLEGWEGRLAKVVEDARFSAYDLGRFDCFRFACQAVHAVTGIDRWPEWDGTYSTKREARLRIKEYGGTFTEAFTKFFGDEPRLMGLADRGDIAEFQDATGEKHLGVVTGTGVALMGENGLVFIPRRACRHAWRVG